jgi:hypothetical protein
MERPAPPDTEDLRRSLAESGNFVSYRLWNPGKSSYVFCFVYGPDRHEVESIEAQLQAAAVDIYKWEATEGLPEDLS